MLGGKKLNFPMRLCIFAEDLKKAFFCYFEKKVKKKKSKEEQIVKI
jgi:hypothetical protein